MKLDPKNWKRFKELESKIQQNTATAAEKAEFAELQAKRNTKGSNDLSWWNNYPELVKGVTNIPFNWIPGRKFELNNGDPQMVPVPLGSIAIAHIAPSIGRSVSDADAFNSQIRQLWLDLHRKYRGIGKYEKSDLGIALYAIVSFFSTLAKFERIYGVINTYAIGNRVVPNGLKESLHIDNDLEENLADFRYTLNLYISKAKQLCLPKGLSILEADLTAISNLFKDSKDRRSFIFGFDSNYYGVFDYTMGDPQGSPVVGSCVKFRTFEDIATGSTDSSWGLNLDDINVVLDAQLSALLNNEDIAIMCSDLLAAYGPENVMTLIDLPEKYVVEPIHDYERLVQFHNLTIHGRVSTIFDGTDFNAQDATYEQGLGNYIIIYQHNNVIKNRLGRGNGTYYNVANDGDYPSFNVAKLAMQSKQGEVIFDTFVEQPGEEEVMCGTRFTNIASKPQLLTTNTYRQEIDILGTNVVEDVEVYYYDATDKIYDSVGLDGSVLSDNAFRSNLLAICCLSQMDWRPTLYHYDDGDFHVFGDLDNFTTIDRVNLDRIHEVALLSGFKIPMVTVSKDK